MMCPAGGNVRPRTMGCAAFRFAACDLRRVGSYATPVASDANGRGVVCFSPWGLTLLAAGSDAVDGGMA